MDTMKDVNRDASQDMKESDNNTITSTDKARTPSPVLHSKTDPDAVTVQLTKTEFVTVFVSLVLAIFLVALDTTIVSTAIPAIAQEFQALDQISWIGTGFFLTSTAFSPTYGSFCDIFGRKATFIFAISLFEIGSLLCGVAPSMIVLIIGRLVAGIGGGGIFAATLIIISDIVSLRDRGKYQGIIGAVFGLSSVVGPLLGGVFTDQISWRWCFYINLPIGLFTGCVVLFMLKFPAPEGDIMSKLHKIDYLGTIVVVSAVTCFLIPLQFGGSEWAWSDAKTIVLFVVSAVLFAIFIFVELKVAHNPLIPAKLFENRSVPLLLAIAFFLGNCFFSINYYVPTFFQLVYGDSATVSGLQSIPMIFGVVFLSILSGQLISRTGHYKIFLLIGPFFLVGGQVLLSTLTPDTHLWQEIIYLLIAGIGIGSIIQVRILGIQASVGYSNIAVATSTSNFCMNLGGTVGIAVAGTIFTNRLNQNLGNQLASEVSHNPNTIPHLSNVDQVRSGIADSLGFVYYYSIPLACLIFLTGIFVEEYFSEKKATQKENASIAVVEA
ncbi:hypothetical protein HDV01_000727 [Terramyces sp. JEL0728]|nr:hypothetical protein HDV01_000727 [Terramyces sp. JEL0728]